MNDPESPAAVSGSRAGVGRWAASLNAVPFALFAAGVPVYGAAFAWAMLDGFDLVNMIRDVNYDDAFYYFQIAHHMAEGRFSTFDGGLTRTNGYHPLWLFLVTPFHWFFDKTEALYAVKALELGLIAGCAVLVAWAARAARLPWVLLFAVAPALYGEPAMYLGMEAAAGLFLLGLFLLAICLHAREPSRWRWLLAAVAFALPWVRLEYVAISLSATAALCLLEGSSRDRPPGARGGGAFVAFLAAVASPLVYFAHNAVVFGGPVPVSGATKLLWAQRAWEREGGYDLVRSLEGALRIPAFDAPLLAALGVCACLPLAWLLLRRSRGLEDRLLLAFLAGAFGIAAGHLAQFAHSILAMHPSHAAGWPWYFAPGHLTMALLVPAACWIAIGLVRRFVRPAAPRAARMANLGIAAAGAAFLLAATDFAAPFRFVDRASESTYRDWKTTYRMGGTVMDRLLPEGVVVGSDAGVLGYFSRLPVVNVDGLVNSWDYLSARREGRENGRAFLRQLGITHFASARGAHRRFDAILFEGPPLRSGSKTLAFVLRPAAWNLASWEGIDRSAWFRERMGPHLERGADGVGLLVDGRMAQAFADDCAPDELAAWTWETDGGREGTTLQSWTKTRTGLCVGAVVLPHGALPPVRVETMTASDWLAERTGDRPPAIRSGFDVHLAGDRLIYMKAPCEADDVAAPFFLHAIPVAPDDLPGHCRRRGFDNLDFRFADRGALADGTCLAEVPLPDYAIAAIRTGQDAPGEGRTGWEARIDPAAPDAIEAVRRAAASVDPVVRSVFDVRLVGDELIYFREPCEQADAELPVFLHIQPADVGDLPEARRKHGFDNLDFRIGRSWDERSASWVCLATRPLPDYAIAAIRTGQYDGSGRIWEGEILMEGR